MQETVGEMIAKAREEKGLSKRELSRLANISDTELARIESGAREVPNPKTLRKISKYIGVNYNDLMYAAGLGFQVTNLNPFLRSYYENLKGEQLEDDLVNTYANIKNWENLISSLTIITNKLSLTKYSFKVPIIVCNINSFCLLKLTRIPPQSFFIFILFSLSFW